MTEETKKPRKKRTPRSGVEGALAILREHDLGKEFVLDALKGVIQAPDVQHTMELAQDEHRNAIIALRAQLRFATIAQDLPANDREVLAAWANGGASATSTT